MEPISQVLRKKRMSSFPQVDLEVLRIKPLYQVGRVEAQELLLILTSVLAHWSCKDMTLVHSDSVTVGSWPGQLWGC